MGYNGRGPDIQALRISLEGRSSGRGALREGVIVNQIRVRLLGGFEVWAGDRQVGGFESQKVRALLTYLVCHRRRAFSRDHLADLLWPEREGDGARHALRQAIYNLRVKLPAGEPLLRSSHLEIGLHPEADCWVDVEAFEEALRLGPSGRSIRSTCRRPSSSTGGSSWPASSSATARTSRTGCSPSRSACATRPSRCCTG